MTLHPSFVYTKERPGLSPSGDAADWWAKRTLLWGIINDAAAEVGAEPVQMDDGQSHESGRDYVYGLDREEPPMTAAKAIEVGDLIISRWEDYRRRAIVAGYCDTVSLLPVPED